MQFLKCARDAVLKPLQVVAGIVDGKQTLPILSNILLTKQGEDVCFTVTDLEIQIKTHAEIGTGDAPLKITVPAGKLTAILSAIPGSATEISLDAEDNKVVLSSTAARFTLMQLPANEYPELPSSTMETKFTLPASTLKHLIQMVHFAMAQQDVRYYLNGMLLEASNGLVQAVATDGHRLACCKAAVDMDLEGKVLAILPKKTVQQLLKLLPDTEDPVEVQIGTTQAQFRFGGIDFLTKLIDGKFPDYERVIPVGNNKMFTVNREELIGALRRAAILTNEKFKGLRWLITPGKLEIQSNNSQMEEAKEIMPIDYQDENLDLGFNVTYLLDVLNNLKCTDVKFFFSSSQGAALVRMPDSDNFSYVLMPMRI